MAGSSATSATSTSSIWGQINSTNFRTTSARSKNWRSAISWIEFCFCLLFIPFIPNISNGESFKSKKSVVDFSIFFFAVLPPEWEIDGERAKVIYDFEAKLCGRPFSYVVCHSFSFPRQFLFHFQTRDCHPFLALRKHFLRILVRAHAHILKEPERETWNFGDDQENKNW